VRAVACPTCEAAIGVACVGPRSGVYHLARRKAAGSAPADTYHGRPASSARKVPCAKCAAPIGEPCRDRDGAPLTRYHAARRRDVGLLPPRANGQAARVARALARVWAARKVLDAAPPELAALARRRLRAAEARLWAARDAEASESAG
jgi:hypothetical protein